MDQTFDIFTMCDIDKLVWWYENFI